MLLTFAGSTAATAGANTKACGSLSLGLGSLTRDSSQAASCLLRAFQFCQPARYQLSTLGVDTIVVRNFNVVRRNGRCEVAVKSSFRVIPQPPHPTSRGYCRMLRRRGTDIVATGCTGGGLPASISLTR